jgi:medium-chain acyl-[acyl-carrier-protein] hydrolase
MHGQPTSRRCRNGGGSVTRAHLLFRMDPLIEALIAALEPYLDRPFVMFGHSLGALTAFEVVRRLRSTGRPLPAHLVVSGRCAPHVRNKQPELHRAPDGEFLQAMHRLFGMPTELLNDSVLMALSMPALRADFELMETWRYRPEAPLEMPITAIGGCSDPTLPYSDMEGGANKPRRRSRATGCRGHTSTLVSEERVCRRYW